MTEPMSTRYIYCNKHPELWIQATAAGGASVRACPDCVKEQAKLLKPPKWEPIQ